MSVKKNMFIPVQYFMLPGTTKKFLLIFLCTQVHISGNGYTVRMKRKL